MKSLWKQDTMIAANRCLEHDTSVSTVVIGAGMTGVLTAYLLQKKGIDTIVLEASRIGSGQTGNTTAKITSQHGLFYSKMKNKVGTRILKGYALANQEAIDRFGQIIKDEKIECDFERLPAVLYTKNDYNIKKLKNEANTAKRLGIQACYTEDMTEKSLNAVNAKAAVCYENQAQFHPMKFLKTLSSKLMIYENTPVISVKGKTVYTNKARVEADYIVFATHYPFINVPGLYFMREHQERGYVLALKKLPKLPAMYYSIDRDGLSLRSHGDVLLLGGGNHRTGKKTTCKQDETGYTFLRRIKEKYYPDAEIAAAWSAQDCMPHDEIPFIGKYSVFRPYWYVATGFKKWGMTSSMIAAEIISSQIERTAMDRNSSLSEDKQVLQYEKVFSGRRMFFMASLPAFMADMWESISGLLKGLFGRHERRCPHMGCRLEWNDEEKSWDCPCHGSRFTNEGELLDNPAKTNL